MTQETFFDKVRDWLGGIGFNLFLWSIRMTADEYLDMVSTEGGLIKRIPDAANVCRVVEHVYIDGTCAECGSPEPQM